ncbi:MAG: ArnT family glycosyltransferase [Patescibacteria group bacterium]
MEKDSFLKKLNSGITEILLAFVKVLKANYAVAILTVVGAFLRFYNFRSTLMFLGDQGRDASIVRNFLVHFDPFLVGPTTSVGKIQLGPFYYYFMAPWLAVFNFDPIGPAIGVALVGVITIPIMYYVVNNLFGKTQALFTTLLYTFGTVVISQTRASWNPSPMPLVILLLVWSVYKVYQNKQYRFIVWTWLLWAIALQLHYMVLLLAPFLGVISIFLFIENKNDTKKIIRYFAWGLLAFVAVGSPLIMFDLRHNFLNARGFLEFFTKGHYSPNVWYQPVLNFLDRMHQGLGEILGITTDQTLRNVVSWGLMLSFAGLFWKNRSKRSFRILGIYLVSSLVSLSFYSGQVMEHYLGFMYPIPFIMLGIVLSWLWNRKIMFFRVISISITLGLIVFNLQHYRYYEPLGWQVDDVKRVSEVIAADSQGEEFNLVLLDETKDYRGMNYRYFLELEGVNLKDVREFENVETLYLISQKEGLTISELETWELEKFFGKTVLTIKQEVGEGDMNYLKEKVVKEWYFPGGPWVYKIQKSK